jgi:hypothetical protein
MWVQVSVPRDDVKSDAGWCLWFTQEVWSVPHQFPTAWVAWQNTQFKRVNRNLPNVCVPVWFDHWGTYGGVYGQYGHVVTYFPGRGYLSSPGRGFGQQWLATIEEVERMFNSTFVGWSEDMQPGVRVVEEVPDSEIEDMAIGAFFRVADGANKGGIFWQEKPNTPFIPINEVETWDAYAANGNKFNNISGSMMDVLKKKYGTENVPSDGGNVNVTVPDFKITMSGEAVKK